MFRFLSWYFFLLIPILALLFFWKKNKRTLAFSSTVLLSGKKHKTMKHKFEQFFIFAGTLLLLTALARPQSSDNKRAFNNYGIDIVLSLDVSVSMNAVDIKPSRLEAAKKVIQNFIAKRTSDRMGLVIFAGTAYTKLPLTIDYNILTKTTKTITTKEVYRSGTAIGMGLSVGINRLKKQDTVSRVIILLTDGDNNTGNISPEAATEIAKNLGIRVYTIGLGTNRTLIPVGNFYGQPRYQRLRGGINEPLLKNIAEETGGRYFRARDEDSLKEIFATIDSLEKSRIKAQPLFQYQEHYHWWGILGLIMIGIGLYFREVLYLKVP